MSFIFLYVIFMVLVMFVYVKAPPLGKAALDALFVIANMFSLAIYLKSGDYVWSLLAFGVIVLTATNFQRNWAVHQASKLPKPPTDG